MKYRVRHTTTYDYESVVLHGRHVAHQRLRSTERQTVTSSALTVSPIAAWSRAGVDYFGNFTDDMELLQPHDQLVVEVDSLVEVHPPTVDFSQAAFRHSWETIRDRLARDSGCLKEREFCFDSPLVRRHPSLAAYGGPTFAAGRPLYDVIVELNHRIFTEFKYEPAATDISTPLGDVLRQKRGVCQDFAHVAVGVLRSMGLAARYVSGYLETRPPPGKARLVGADASHAWASVFVPEWGWLDFDPTNDVLPKSRHITVGWGRDFSDVSPLKGIVLGGGRHVVRVGVDVEPLEPNAATPVPPAVAEEIPDQIQQQQQQQQQASPEIY